MVLKVVKRINFVKSGCPLNFSFLWSKTILTLRKMTKYLKRKIFISMFNFKTKKCSKRRNSIGTVYRIHKVVVEDKSVYLWVYGGNVLRHEVLQILYVYHGDLHNVMNTIAFGFII